jgi:hypothetical protein
MASTEPTTEMNMKEEVDNKDDVESQVLKDVSCGAEN